ENRYLVWQTGSQYFDAISGRIADHPRLRLMQYLDRMDLAYAVADVVVSRAGAITCSELMLTGAPAILVPPRHAAEDHRPRNARRSQEAAAARLLPVVRLSAELVTAVAALLAVDARRTAMSAAARAIARPDAATEIARDVLHLAKQA